MRRHQTPTSAYESWCNHCQTSFAAGTKRCIHCGERLARERRPFSLRTRSAEETVALPPEIEDLLVEDDVPKKKSPFSPLTLIWIAVLLGGYLFQLCSQT